MGRPKKAKPKCKQKLITKYRVTINKQWRDFWDQDEARKYAKEVLQNDAIFFLKMHMVKVKKTDC